VSHARGQGVGYLEHLHVNSKKMRLPFRKLWWGRAHAGQSSVVWIRWGNGRELNLVIEDGVQARGSLESMPNGGMRIETARGQWETGNNCRLEGLGHSLPGWLLRLGKRMAPAKEVKRSGPVCFRTGTGAFTGSALWEEVEWA